MKQKLFFKIIGLVALASTLFFSCCPPVHHRIQAAPPATQPMVIGGVESVDLLELGLLGIVARVDTGAKTSSLHAIEIEEFKRGGKRWVRFKTEAGSETRALEAPLVGHRRVKNTSGKAQTRPIIRTTVKIGRLVKEIEINLSNRKNMHYRLLLGREALNDTILVKSNQKFIISQPTHL